MTDVFPTALEDGVRTNTTYTVMGLLRPFILLLS